MNRRKLFFIANGNSNIGMGHISRCLAIAQKIKCTFDICFLSQFSNQLENIFKGYNINHYFIESKSDILEKINSDRECYIITDSYELQECDYKVLKENCKKLISIIDYTGVYNYADLIISPNICLTSNDFKCSDNCRVLSGKEYLILKDSILNSKLDVKESNIITITLGGSDLYSATPTIIEALNEFKNIREYKVKIIIGPFFENIDDIKKSNVLKFQLIQNCNNLGPILSKSKYAIISGGVTLHECLYLKTIPIVFIQANNQIDEVKKVKNDNKLIYVGNLETIKKFEIKNNIMNIFNNIYQYEKIILDGIEKYIDGKGIVRIVNIINKM